MRLRMTLLAALALTAIGAPAAHGASTLGPEAVDARFGSCGVRQVRIPSTASAAQRVAIAADGSAVIAGTAGPVAGNRDRLLFQRLRPDGSVDRSFAGAGVNVVQIPPAQGRQPTDFRPSAHRASSCASRPSSAWFLGDELLALGPQEAQVESAGVVEVVGALATRSKSSAAGRPASRSSSASTSAGMMPRMPPPSTERMRTRGAIV